MWTFTVVHKWIGTVVCRVTWLSHIWTECFQFPTNPQTFPEFPNSSSEFPRIFGRFPNFFWISKMFSKKIQDFLYHRGFTCISIRFHFTEFDKGLINIIPRCLNSMFISFDCNKIVWELPWQQHWFSLTLTLNKIHATIKTWEMMIKTVVLVSRWKTTIRFEI